MCNTCAATCGHHHSSGKKDKKCKPIGQAWTTTPCDPMFQRLGTGNREQALRLVFNMVLHPAHLHIPKDDFLWVFQVISHLPGTKSPKVDGRDQSEGVGEGGPEGRAELVHPGCTRPVRCPGRNSSRRSCGT